MTIDSRGVTATIIRPKGLSMSEVGDTLGGAKDTGDTDPAENNYIGLLAASQSATIEWAASFRS